MIRRVLQTAAFVVLVLAVVLALVWLGQRRLIYLPDTSTPSLDVASPSFLCPSRVPS